MSHVQDGKSQASDRGNGGGFCISLDFELIWGVRDKRTIDQYGKNILGGREAVKRMLDLFERNGIRATWASVGMLFCETKDELLASLPDLQPTYDNAALSNYAYFDEVGDNEAKDPYHFAPSLLDRIATCPGQEIATHTFSHYYCLEPGQTGEQFSADLDAAIAVATRRNVSFRSIVFPRNQYDARSISECAHRGIRVYRGNPPSWIYRPSPGSDQTLSRRAVRLADAYVNLSGENLCRVETYGGVTNVQASAFFRPVSGRLRPLEPLRLWRIMQAMTVAAKRGETFHLWWHPHNFGVHEEVCFAGLQKLIAHYRSLADRHEFRSCSMADLSVREHDTSCSPGAAHG